jgi:hypothetical protein
MPLPDLLGCRAEKRSAFRQLWHQKPGILALSSRNRRQACRFSTYNMIGNGKVSEGDTHSEEKSITARRAGKRPLLTWTNAVRNARRQHKKKFFAPLFFKKAANV